MKDRSTKFRLKASGWGVFLIRVTVKTKNGNDVPLTHYLKLEYPGQAAARDPGG